MNKGTINQDVHVEALLDHLAPMKARPGVAEHYTPEGLAKRLGLTVEEVAEIMEAGVLHPVFPLRKTEAGEMAGFDGSDLDRVRRGAILAGLQGFATKHPDIDSHDLAAAASQSIGFASRRGGVRVVEFSEESKQRLRNAMSDGEVRFAEARADRALLRAGCRRFGIQFAEAPGALNGKVVRDRYVKKIKDEDENRRDANLLRASVAGAAAGALLPVGKSLSPLMRAGIGAKVGAIGVLGIRAATEGGKDRYGDRSREAKRAEALPAAAGVAVAGVSGLAALKKILAARKMKFSRAEKDIVFEAFREQRGQDLRMVFGSEAYSDDRIIEFAIDGISPAIMDLLRRSGKFLKGALLPGTTSRKVIDSGVAGAGVGAIGGASQAILDGDPNTGALGGVVRGAAGGAAVGGALGLVRGAAPVAGGFRPGMDAAADKLKRAAARRGVVFSAKAGRLVVRA